MERGLRIVILILIVLVLVILLVGLGAQVYRLFSAPDSGTWGMMPWRSMPMHPWGMPGRFGIFGAGLGGLLGLGLLLLAGLGLTALFLRRPAGPPSRACSNCGKPLQAEWTVCPHCGQKV